MSLGGVLSSTTPTPKSKKLSSLVITDGLEIQGTFVNNALQTSQDSMSLVATKTTNQSIGDGDPFTNVTFPNIIGTAPPTTVWNQTNDFDYTAPVTGLYAVTSDVVWEPNASGTRQVAIFVNNAAVLIQRNNAGPGGVNGETLQTISGIFPVTAGQIINIRVQNLSGAGALNVQTTSHLNIQLIRRTA